MWAALYRFDGLECPKRPLASSPNAFTEKVQSVASVLDAEGKLQPSYACLFHERKLSRAKVMLRPNLCYGGIKMLGHRLAAKSTRDRANSCTDDRA